MCFKDYKYTKSLSDDLVVTCDEVVDMPKTASINS